MEFFFVNTMPFKSSLIYTLVNFSNCVEVRYSRFFIIIFAALIFASSLQAKLLLARIKVSSVYIPTMPNELNI